MQCLNALCNKIIGLNDEHIKAHVAESDEFWCDTACLAEWEHQNQVFLIAADPFIKKEGSYGHKRRKQLFGY